MPVVQDTLFNAGGDPSAYIVQVDLVGANGAPVVGYVAGDSSRIVVPFDARPDSTTGTWSADLVPNSLIIPAGTVYAATVRAHGATPVYFAVPDVAGPLWLGDLLTDIPASIASSALAAEIARAEAAEASLAAAIALAAPLASPTFTGVPVVPALSVTGLTGSVVGGRIVGFSAGAPTTGAHLLNDLVWDTTNGLWLRCTVAGTPGTWAAAGNGMYAPAGSKATYAARVQRTSGDITANGTSWANLDTGLDLVLSASAGQFIEVGLCAQIGAQAVSLMLDVGSLVTGAIVKVWGTDAAENNAHEGAQCWQRGSGLGASIGGSIIRAVEAGDLSAGTLTLRFRVRTGTASNRTIYAAAGYPLVVWAVNHG